MQLLMRRSRVILLIITIAALSGNVKSAPMDTVKIGDWVKLGDQPADVVYNGRTVTRYFATLLGSTPQQRADATVTRIEQALDNLQSGQIVVSRTEAGYAILLDTKPTVFITELDKDPVSTETIAQVVEKAKDNLDVVVHEYQETHSVADILRGVAVFIIASAIFYVLLRLVLFGRKKALEFTVRIIEHRIEQTQIKNIVVGSRFVPIIISRVIGVLAVLLILIVSFLYLTIVFKQFPVTRAFGEHMLNIVTTSALFLLEKILNSIPSLLMVGLIYLIARYTIRGLGTVLKRIERGQIEIRKFDKELIPPTRRIVTVFIWIFAFALAYPYIPGSSTDAFKGVSVVVGLMLSLGASGAIAQIASGLILMYSRKIRSGDWITVGDHTGKVVSIGFALTHLETTFKEEVIVPNVTILTSTLVNHTRAAKVGSVYSTGVTIGYDAAWRLIHKMLLGAAGKTQGVLPEPEPVVTQHALNDFYVEYKLTVHISSDADRRLVISDLHANIQDEFNINNVQIMSPHYISDPAKPKVIDRSRWDPPLSQDGPHT